MYSFIDKVYSLEGLRLLSKCSLNHPFFQGFSYLELVLSQYYLFILNLKVFHNFLDLCYCTILLKLALLCFCPALSKSPFSQSNLPKSSQTKPSHFVFGESNKSVKSVIFWPGQSQRLEKTYYFGISYSGRGVGLHFLVWRFHPPTVGTFLPGNTFAPWHMRTFTPRQWWISSSSSWTNLSSKHILM